MSSRVSSCLHTELLTRLTGVSFFHVMLPSVTRSLGQNCVQENISLDFLLVNLILVSMVPLLAAQCNAVAWAKLRSREHFSRFLVGEFDSCVNGSSPCCPV